MGISSQHLDAQFMASLHTAFASQLPKYFPRQRWFGSKARHIHSVQLSECIPVRLSNALALITYARVEFAEGPDETYVLPLIVPEPGQIPPADLVVVRVPVLEPPSELSLIDALANQDFLAAILDAIFKSESFPGSAGELRAAGEAALGEQNLGPAKFLTPRLLKGEQSNTSIVYADRLILKFFRRIEEGMNPDEEISHFLTAVTHFANIPRLCGWLKYRSRDGKFSTLGILQAFVPNQGDAWRFTVATLVEHFTSLDHPTEQLPAGSSWPAVAPSEHTISGSGELNEQLQLIGLLGKRTAELHLALASSSADPNFAPELFTSEFCEELDVAFHDLTVRNFNALRSKTAELPEPIAELAKEVLALEDDALLVLHSVLGRNVGTVRTRIHGDYHLGQVLFTGSDFFIIDFEGEPARPLNQRRDKRSPLQDVAGMLRSFHYAARSAALGARERLEQSHQPDGHVEKLAAQWRTLASSEFLQAYRLTVGDARFLPSSADEFTALLRVHVLEKAVYELGYELNNRPSWVAIPLEGIREILTTKS